MRAVVAAFNQEKALVGALVGAFSVITNLRMELFEAQVSLPHCIAWSTSGHLQVLQTGSSSHWGNPHPGEEIRSPGLCSIRLHVLRTHSLHSGG